jgi:VanZ family protein
LHPTWQKKRIGILCNIVIIAVLIATLWPFNFFPQNRISWLAEANGIRFGGPGLVVSKAPLRPEGVEPRKDCSLELFLRPASIEGSFTILGFYVPNNHSQFLVRQWTDGLLVTHDIVNVQNKMKRTKFDVNHAFQQGKLVLLTITSGPSGTMVYLNARQTQTFSRFTISQSELSGQIVMGTSPVEYQPWSGDISGLAIYSKELTPAEVLGHYRNWTDERGLGPPDLDGAIAHYTFTEGVGRDIHNAVVSGPDLEMPKWFAVPRKALLQSPVKEFEANWDYVNDIVRNIAGFVPLGFILCAYWGLTRTRWQAILYTILAGGVLSFLIEVLQFYIPQRNSGMTDIITNTLGAALGAVLARPNMVRMILGRTKSISM